MSIILRVLVHGKGRRKQKRKCVSLQVDYLATYLTLASRLFARSLIGVELRTGQFFAFHNRDKSSRQAMRIQPYLLPANYFNRRACRIRSYTSQATLEPLRILFCGSDEFSIASLRALYREHERDKALIESIDVVCRPAKPVGRGLKETREGKLFQARSPVPVLNKII